jgi:hypothetical protein
MAPDTRWTAYDDELKAARNEVDSQVTAARTTIADDSVLRDTVDRYVRYLSGDTSGVNDPRLLNGIIFLSELQPVIEANNAATNQNLTLADFFAGPQRVNAVTEDDVLISGTFDVFGLTETLFDNTNVISAGGTLRTKLEVAQEIYETANTDLSALDDRLAEAEANLEYLLPKQELLDSDNARDQVRGLSIWGDVTGDDIIGRLEAEDKPSALTAEMREQFAAVRETVSPEAQRRGLRATVDSKPEVEDAPSAQEAQQAEFDAILERKRQEIAAARVTPRQREGQRLAAMNETGYDLGSAPAPAPRPSGMPGDGAPPAPRPREMPGDGAPGRAPGTPRGRGSAPETFSPEAVRRGISATVEETADVVVSTDSSVVSGSGDGGARLSAAQIRDANQAEVELLLAQQFGGFSFFLQKHRSELQVGLTADGQVVAADDPNAATVKNVLDVIVDQGITAPTRVLGLLENTEWWKATDARMREYDVLTADMSEPQKAEYLEPVLDTLRDEAQFLGFQLDPTRARELAEQITRMGEEGDAEYIRGLLTAEEAFNAAEVSSSSFAAARDEIVAMSKRYFTPINEADAAAFAEDIYVGTKTAEGVEQYFREMAANKFPSMQNALDSGITPEQYFAPYKYEIERMLDRPNVDLYEEFGDIIQYIPDTGTGEARPMTLGEVRKYVRGLDEWQQSSQGKDSARALSFSIGKLFGEVA